MSKAVRECSKNNPALVSHIMSQYALTPVTDHISNIPELSHPDHTRGQKSSNNSGSHSMDESSSTEEALSRRSNSPAADVDHRSYNQAPATTEHQTMDSGHPRLAGTVVESSCGRIAYLSSAQMNSFNEPVPLASAFPDQEPNSTSMTPAGSEFFNFNGRSANASLSNRASRQMVGSSRPLVQPRTDYTRWLASRTALPVQDHQEFPLNSAVQLPLSRFSNDVNQTQGHGGEVGAAFLGGAEVTRPNSGGSKLDIRINLGFNQQGGMQENAAFGYRSFSGPLTSSLQSNGAGSGPTGSILDITTQHALSGYAAAAAAAGQYPSSVTPNNTVNLTSFNSSLAGTPSGMRLHEYEVPSPRMVLWDFQE